LLILNKLDLKIVYKLFTNLALIDFSKASIILTNGYVSFDLIDYIFIANKQLLFLTDKCAKAIKGD
jgi:hypothetical protein